MNNQENIYHLKNKADSISTLAENFTNILENIKTNSLLSVKDPTRL